MCPWCAPTPAQGSCTQLTRAHTFTQGFAEHGITSELRDWIGLLLSVLFWIVAGYGVAVVFDDRQQDRRLSSWVRSRPERELACSVHALQSHVLH